MANVYMAIDQYGETYHDLERPRRDLLQRLNRRHADKMYVDLISTSEARHCGYVIAGRWLRVFEVTPINTDAA